MNASPQSLEHLHPAASPDAGASSSFTFTESSTAAVSENTIDKLSSGSSDDGYNASTSNEQHVASPACSVNNEGDGLKKHDRLRVGLLKNLGRGRKSSSEHEKESALRSIVNSMNQKGVEFVVQLGGIMSYDLRERSGSPSVSGEKNREDAMKLDASFVENSLHYVRNICSELNIRDVDLHHVIGEEEAHVCNAAQLISLPLRTSASLSVVKDGTRSSFYYEFSPRDGWRFVILDIVNTGNDAPKITAQASWLAQVLQAATESREGVIIFAYQPPLWENIRSIIEDCGKSCIVACVFGSSADRSLDLTWELPCISFPGQGAIIEIENQAWSSPQLAKSAGTRLTVSKIGGDADSTIWRRLETSAQSRLQIYDGPIENALIGAEFLYPYMKQGSRSTNWSVLRAKVQSYDPDTRWYTCNFAEGYLERFTFAQLSSCGVGAIRLNEDGSHLGAGWIIGRENDTLKQIAEICGLRGSSKSVSLLVHANRAFYPTMGPISLLKEGTMIRIPHETWEYPQRLEYLGRPRPLEPPPLPISIHWVQCDTCKKWRIMMKPWEADNFVCGDADRSCKEPEDEEPGRSLSLTEKIKRKSKKRVWSQPDVELVSPDLSDIQEANCGAFEIFKREYEKDLTQRLSILKKFSKADEANSLDIRSAEEEWNSMEPEKVWKYRIKSDRKIRALRNRRLQAEEKRKLAELRRADALRQRQIRNEENQRKRYAKRLADGEVPPSLAEVRPWVIPQSAADFFKVGDVCERKWPGDGMWYRCSIAAIRSEKMWEANGGSQSGPSETDGNKDQQSRVVLDLGYSDSFSYEKGVHDMSNLRFAKPKPRWRLVKKWKTIQVQMDRHDGSLTGMTSESSVRKQTVAGVSFCRSSRGTSISVCSIAQESPFASILLHNDEVISVDGEAIDFKEPDMVRRKLLNAIHLGQIMEIRRLLPAVARVRAAFLNRHLQNAIKVEAYKRSGPPSICQASASRARECVINSTGAVKSPPRQAGKYSTAVCRSHAISVENDLDTTFSKAWYFEATVISLGAMQIGWAALPGFVSTPMHSAAVGDCNYSWSFDGFKGAF